MLEIVNNASQANSLLNAISGAVENIIRTEKEGMDLPDVKQLKTFIAACNQDLSGNIKKLVKLDAGKKAEIAKLAKTIKETVETYEGHLEKLTGATVKMFADANLAPQLEKIKKVVKVTVKSQTLSEQDIETLKKAQTAWSDAKPKGLAFCNQELANHVKMKLETIKGYQSDLKSLNMDTHAKLLKGLKQIKTLSMENAKATVKSLLPLIVKFQKDTLAFSSTKLGYKNTHDYANELKDTASELVVAANLFVNPPN